MHPMLRDLPEAIKGLGDLSLDLRWTWSHGADALWNMIDAELWQRTRNPWLLLQTVPPRRLQALAQDAPFRAELARVQQARQEYLSAHTRWDDMCPEDSCNPIAYFSMEFGVGEALPVYSGGLGVLAGDHLKTASDLGVPIVGHRSAVPGRLLPADAGRPRPPDRAVPGQSAAYAAAHGRARRRRRTTDRASRSAGPHLAAAGLAGPGRPRAAVPARFERPAEQPGRSRHHRPAVWGRQGNATGAGDRARHRRLAAARGARHRRRRSAT